MQSLNQALEPRADIGNRFRFPIGVEFQCKSGCAMRVTMFGLTAKKDHLVSQPLQCFAHREGERFNAAYLG